MSAVNIFVQHDAAYVITDAARYDEAGTLIGIGPKCEGLPHLPALVAVRGPCQALPLILNHLGWRFQSFDELLDGIAEALRDIHAGYAQFFEATGFPEVELYFAGWSASRVPHAFRRHEPGLVRDRRQRWRGLASGSRLGHHGPTRMVARWSVYRLLS